MLCGWYQPVYKRSQSIISLASLTVLCGVLIGCSPEPPKETVQAESQPTFKQDEGGAPKAGGLGQPMLNPNFKPPQRRHKNLKVPNVPD